MAINISNISFINYLWTKKNSDGTLTGIRLSKNNLPTDTVYTNDIPTALKNPNALTFGSKTYDGSSAQTLTLSDLGGNIINCYNTSTTDKPGTWTVTIPNVTELTEGLTIKIRLKTGYNSNINTLNVNGLGAKTVYFRYGNKLTGHYSKESVLALTYTSDAISSGNDKSGWIIENIYDSTNTFQLRKYYSRYTTKSVLYRYMICFVNKDNLLVPANNVNNSTSTNKTLTGDNFDLSKGIYYYNSTTTVAAGSLTGTGTLYQQIGLINLQYSFNTGTTLIANKPVYLVVTPLGEHGEVILATNPIAQEIPTTNDGNRYVFLGYAYDTYRIELTLDHPVYVYNSIKGCYTSEISNLENNKVSKSGDTISGNLSPSTTKGASLGTPSLYWNDIYGTTVYEGGTSLADKYLGKTAKAADADKLDGKDSTYYLNYNNLTNRPTKLSAFTNDSGYVTGPSSSTTNAVPRYADATGKKLKDSGVTISDANVLSAAQLAANIIETGTGDNNYFQSRKFRGEGNAATYYHAVDFGFAGHNQVDFYEYGGLWNFWKNTNAAATSDINNLCLQIGDTYVKNKGNTFTWPTTSGTLALTSNIPAAGTTASAVSTTASGGSATTWSKSDHVHNISLATGDNNGQVKIAGTNVSVKGLGSAAYTNSNAYATSGHTHSFSQITSRGEAFLDWGGKNFSGSYGPIDAAMVPELGANRLAFMPANAVTIEYSRDGGATWIDYGAADYQKISLFNGIGSGLTIGKASSGAGNIATNKYQLRVNIYTGVGNVYTILNKFVIYLSTSGTNNNWCTIRARKQSDYTAGNDTWTTFADKISVSGWSGYNVINTSGITTYGNSASSQYGHIQFIFGCDTGSTNNSYPGLTINKIFGFGGVGWTTPSTMAKTGHMYTYDSSQNVTFPAAITSGTINSYSILPRGNNSYNLGSDNSKWANIYATTIHENGKTLSAKYIAKPLLTTKGDMIYASGTSNPDRLGIGSNGQFLSIANGVPKWVNNPNSDTHYTNYLQIKGNGAEAVKFTQNADKSLDLKPGNNVSISAASGEITISATVPNKSSWNYDDAYIKYSAAQSLNDTQKTQARTNIGAGTITEIKVNGTSKGTSGSVNLTNMVTFASSQTATVAGTSKTTYTYNQPTGDSNTGSSNGSAYFPEGIIMGGTAASAGLVTRGICGVATPDATTGACTKENLYINYDGDNNNNPNGRGVVINAGSSGSDLGNGVYSYCAVRGDAMKAYCDNHYATKAELNTTNAKIAVNAKEITTLKGYFSSGIANKATADAYGNNIVDTYATKSALNITNGNVTTLQGYFSNGIAKRAAADGNGKGITTEYVHTRVDGGISPNEMYSKIEHRTDESEASVWISAENTNSFFGGKVYVGTDYTELYYGDGRDGCALKLTTTDATLQFVDRGTEYSIITTKDTATANNAGLMKAAAVRTSAITTTTGKTTTTGYYGVELDSDGKAFVAIPWSAIPTSLVPSSNGSYNLGSSSYKWSYVYANYIGSSSYKVTTAYITNIGSSSYKTNYVYANYIGHASYPCTAVYTNKLQFDVANYITNIASGSFDITMSNGSVGTQASYDLTIPNHSTGNGTWHVFVTVTGAYCNSTFVGVGGEVSSTGGCTIWVRNGYTTTSRTITIHWLAVKF